MEIKELEMKFLSIYPEGFDSDGLIDLQKKHNVEGIHAYVKESFTQEAFDQAETILEYYRKLMNKSTLVSRFEKAPFKDFITNVDEDIKIKISKALYEVYFGDEGLGFNQMIEILRPYKLAKWPVISMIFAYKDPQFEVFIKPTTTKAIIKSFNSDLVYKPRPSYEFYRAYRDFINDLKSNVSKSVAPNNPAFTGFLMLALGME